ncbi:hypothetical protein BGW38_006939 [Lunasporangiospora selenospora]|uniref:BTB domain-containing protein n=1 Tax=Lunasporangiospora selenospora TaxID=979761 RepID=A0A9P6KIU1_9FUNG|nr:hypothetical protein BGW38_006939 [Lunasporangiospora selenospora]
MNHSVVCPEQGPGTVSRGHSWLHQDNASSPQDESTMMATVDNLDYPPVSYIAETIAKELMVDGDQMFNRMSDATCILVVGNARYYVHVQMLASRSPTFRDIFDEMIASGAWDMTSTSSSSGEESSSSDILSDNGDGDCHMNDAPTSRSVDHLDVTMDDNSGPRSVPNTVNTQSGRSYTNNTTAANIDLRADAESLNTQLIRPLHIFSIKPSMVYGFDSENEGATEGSTDGSDIDDDSTLPTLTIALSDPTGTHIEELLYWIYTGNKERWLMSFNVDNYRFILNNILYLRLATEEVVTVCKEFEDSVGTSLGIQGLAQQVLRKKLG